MNPNQAQARLQNGVRNLQTGNFSAAESDFRAVLKADKRNFPALNLISVALMQQKRFADAEPYLKSACALNASSASTLYNYGLVLVELSRPKDALTQFDKVVALTPEDAEAWNSRGLALKSLSRNEEAIESLRKALKFRPGYADAHFNLGNLLQQLGRDEESLAAYRQAMALNPQHHGAFINHANVLIALGRFEEALISANRAVMLRPQDAASYYNRGQVFGGLERSREAVEDYTRAISLKLDYAEAYHNRANVYARKRHHEMAIADFEKAIELRPDNYDSYFGLGMSCLQLSRFSDAVDAYHRVLAVDGRQPEALLQSLYAQMHLCCWDDYEAKVTALQDIAAKAPLEVTPFPMMQLPLNARVIHDAVEQYIKDQFPPSATRLWNGEKYNHDRIRIAYFSSDFREHPVAFLTAELFERHDRSRFQTFGFALSPKSDSAMTQRIAAAFDEFLFVNDETTQAVAKMVREKEIDVLIDLNGLTAGLRPGIFALRPAPVQVNYLGYPSTMGASYMDYIVGDATVIPPELFDCFTEKVVHLPHTFQVNDSKRPIADRVPSRAELGLPDDGFVFCCFNNNFKITPDVFEIWMRLMAKTPGSVLWLRQDSPAIQGNLLAEAQKRGIAPERLIFAPRTPTLADHLARQKRADLFVDTFYYGAHTTASDALWAGLPVLTCLGDTYASRVAASILKVLDLPELITYSHAEYEERILELVAARPKLAELRARLERNAKTHPLFDTGLFTRHMEAAYIAMWQRTQDGLPPDHIVVAP